MKRLWTVGLCLILFVFWFSGTSQMQEAGTNNPAQLKQIDRQAAANSKEFSVGTKLQTRKLDSLTAQERISSLRNFLADTNQQTVEPNQSGNELILNGSFDEPRLSWIFEGPIILSRIARSGQSAAFGLINNNLEEAYQTVTIPSGSGSATIRFWLNIDSDESPSAPVRDVFGLQILDTSGRLLKTIAAFSNRDDQALGTFTMRGPYDLSAYRGTTIQVSFLGSTDGSLPTDFRLDDVSLLASSESTEFILTVTPQTQTIQAGQIARYGLALNTPNSGLTVEISPENLPPSTQFSSPYGLFPFPFDLITDRTTPPGRYDFRIKGVARGITRYGLGQIVITPPAPDNEPPTVRVVSPNGGEKFKRGVPVTITWESNDNSQIVRHEVYILADGSTSFLGSFSGAARSLSYTFPTTSVKVKSGIVQIQAFDANGNKGQDQSDGTFKVK